MRYINVESDFKLLESFDCNCEVNLRDSEFEFEYYTKKHSDNRITVSYKDGKCSTTCKFTDDNRLIVLFENHNLEPGTLKVKRYFNLNDADFSDKTCDFVIEEELPISLTKGIQPCTEECCYVDVKLPPYYQKGDIGPIGPKGDKGDQGDKGDKGDLTVTGITPHNNLLDNTAFNQFDYEGNLLYWNIIGDAETKIHGGDSGIGNNALLIKSYEDPEDNNISPNTQCIEDVGYVLSLYTKAYNTEKSTLLIKIPNLHRGKFYVDGQQGEINNLGHISLEQSTNWEKHYITFTVTGKSPIFFAAPSTSDDGVLIAQVKLESNPINGLPDLGNIVPTPWTLSTNDLKGKDIYELLVESDKFEGTREEFEDEYIDSIKAVKNATEQAITEANNAQKIGQDVQQTERDIIQRDYERSDAFDLAQSNRQQAYENAEDIRNSEYRKAESSRNSGFGSAENNRNNIFLQYESIRQNNETLRSNAEEDRKKAESDRQALFQSNEESRQNTFNTNETTRQNNEIIRQNNEAGRKTKEAERQSIFSTNETERQRIFETNEALRQENEDKRVDAEILRQEAETIREATYKNKVDRDDNAPKLTAGFANNLVGRGEATPQEISFRPSGGDTSIEDGTARIDRLKGSTVVWNQLLKCEFTNGETYGGTVKPTVQDGKGYLTFTATGDSFTTSFNATTNHYYLWEAKLSASTGCRLFMHSYGVLTTLSASTDMKVVQGIVRYTSSSAEKTVMLLPISNITEPTDIVVDYYRLYDLTQMFGAGNEPTTIEEFYARKPIGIDEYAYNEGELISTNVDEIKSVGFNAWDEEWEEGIYSTTNGNKIAISGRWRCKNLIPVLPNTKYYKCVKSGGSVRYGCYYDKDKNFVSRHDCSNNNVFTTPSNAHYLTIYCEESYGATYKGDVCIHLAHTGYRNGEYEPYKEFRRNIPIKDIKDKDGNQLFPNGLLSAGSVYDEITPTKAIKRVNRVVLNSSESWSLHSINSYGIANFLAVTNQLFGSTVAISDKLPLQLSLIASTESEGFLIPGIGNSIYIRIKSTTASTVEQFKTWLSQNNITLHYASVEPIEVDLPEPLNLDYEVSDFGTEEVISDAPTTPMKADIIYQFNAVDRIRDNSRHTAESVELLNAKADKTAVEAAINELTNAIPDVVNDLTTGGADKALSAEMGKELKSIISKSSGLFNNYGYYIKPNGSINETSNPNAITDYIPLDRVDKIIIRGRSSTLVSLYAFYDENKNFIDSVYGGEYNNTTITVNSSDFPANAKYFIGNGNGNGDDLLLGIGTNGQIITLVNSLHEDVSTNSEKIGNISSGLFLFPLKSIYKESIKAGVVKVYESNYDDSLIYIISNFATYDDISKNIIVVKTTTKEGAEVINSYARLDSTNLIKSIGTYCLYTSGTFSILVDWSKFPIYNGWQGGTVDGVLSEAIGFTPKSEQELYSDILSLTESTANLAEIANLVEDIYSAEDLTDTQKSGYWNGNVTDSEKPTFWTSSDTIFTVTMDILLGDRIETNSNFTPTKAVPWCLLNKDNYIIQRLKNFNSLTVTEDMVNAGAVKLSLCYRTTTMVDTFFVRRVRNSISNLENAINELRNNIDDAVPKFGKKVLLFGDSQIGQCRMESNLSQLLNTDVYNFGFGGCRWAWRTSDGSSPWDAYTMVEVADALVSKDFTKMDSFVSTEDIPSYFANAVAQMKTLELGDGSEYIATIAYGGNDYAGGTKLGEIDSLDKTKLYGAINHVISRLLSAYPALTIHVVSPTYRVYEKDTDGSILVDSDEKVITIDGTQYKRYEYGDKILEHVRDYHRLPTYDMYRRGGRNRYNIYSICPDGTHPTSELGRKLTAEKYEKIIKSF